jgi:sec-independent protein translocase protein TatC
MYFIFCFISPALHPKEKVRTMPILILLSVFLFAGLAFAKWVTIPFANQYFFQFDETLGANHWNLSSYIDYTVGLLVANGVAFQMGALLLGLIHHGLITTSQLQRFRKIGIVAIFIISAILTPPDVFTQLMMAIPLMIIYELGILWAKFRN